MNATQPANVLEFTLPRVDMLFSVASGDWKARAIAAYRQSAPKTDAAFRATMARRIKALAGHTVALESVWVDRAEGIAVAVVDGVHFHLENSRLTVMHACEECGLGQLFSPELRTPADLGYALSEWHPLHATCQPEDRADYLDFA